MCTYATHKHDLDSSHLLLNDVQHATTQAKRI